jgi:hypothetical protein
MHPIGWLTLISYLKIHLSSLVSLFSTVAVFTYRIHKRKEKKKKGSKET